MHVADVQHIARCNLFRSVDALGHELKPCGSFAAVFMQVLSHALHAVCMMWQSQTTTHRPVALLRQLPATWDALEVAILASHKCGGDEPRPHMAVADAAWLQLSEAYAWQVRAGTSLCENNLIQSGMRYTLDVCD